MNYEVIVLVKTGNPIDKILEYFEKGAITFKHIVYKDHKLDQQIDGHTKCDLLFIQLSIDRKIRLSEVSIPCLRFILYRVNHFVPFNAVNSWFENTNNDNNQKI